MTKKHFTLIVVTSHLLVFGGVANGVDLPWWVEQVDVVKPELGEIGAISAMAATIVPDHATPRSSRKRCTTFSPCLWNFFRNLPLERSSWSQNAAPSRGLAAFWRVLTF